MNEVGDLSDVQSHPGDSAEIETLAAEAGADAAAAAKTETGTAEDGALSRSRDRDPSDAGESDAEPAEDEGKSGSDKPRRKSGLERMRERLAASEAELAELRSRQRGDSAGRDAVEAMIGPAPNEADFGGDFLAYERALTAYEVERRIAARDLQARARAEEARAIAARRDAVETFQERLEDYARRIPDLGETLAKATDIPIAPHVRELILDSDKGPHLAYTLAKDPAKAEALNGMSPVRAARELGRIEARLSLPSETKATRAPAPVAPVRGGASPASAEKDLDAWLARKYGKR